LCRVSNRTSDGSRQGILATNTEAQQEPEDGQSVDDLGGSWERRRHRTQDGANNDHGQRQHETPFATNLRFWFVLIWLVRCRCRCRSCSCCYLVCDESENDLTYHGSNQCSSGYTSLVFLAEAFVLLIDKLLFCF